MTTLVAVIGQHGYDYFTDDAASALIGQQPRIEVDGILMPCVGTVVDAVMNHDHTVTVTIKVHDFNIMMLD